jgi:DNA-directed RNA polymerase specialized sigma24 family protein
MTAQESFTAALPTIEKTIKFNLRARRPSDREELVQSARVAAWCAWRSLCARGVDPVAVGITGIAFNAARSARAGRRYGCGRPGPQSDVMNPRARCDGWERCTLEDYVGSHDDVGARLDFASWLDSLPDRKRRVAELLAEGYGTGEVSRECGISPGRVSQLRAELEKSWRTFQGE